MSKRSARLLVLTSLALGSSLGPQLQAACPAAEMSETLTALAVCALDEEGAQAAALRNANLQAAVAVVAGSEDGCPGVAGTCPTGKTCIFSGAFDVEWDCDEVDTVPCPRGGSTSGFLCSATITSARCKCGVTAPVSCAKTHTIPLGEGKVGPYEFCARDVLTAAGKFKGDATVIDAATTFGNDHCDAIPCTADRTCARDTTVGVPIAVDTCVSLGQRDCPQGQLKFSCEGRVTSVTCKCVS